MRRSTVIFALTVAAAAQAAKASFTISDLVNFNGTNGSEPEGTLLLSGSTFYGVTNGGTVYSVPTSGGNPANLTAFTGTSGGEPDAGVILSGNTLYGTLTGGSLGGEVYSLPVAGGTATQLSPSNAELLNVSGGVVLSGGNLYGETTGLGVDAPWEIFSVPAAGGSVNKLASGNSVTDQPSFGMVLSGSTLYGVMAGNTSALFSIPVAGGAPTILCTLPVGGGGALPSAIMLSGDTLYGVIGSDIYSERITGGTPTVLGIVSGQNAIGALALSGGTLYGTTASEVFSLPAAGGPVSVLASFNGLDGSQASGFTGGLVVSGGTIYGTTQLGGLNNDGVVFKLVTTPQVVSFSAAAPSGFGSQLGSLSLSGSLPAAATFSPTQTGYVQTSPWSPTNTTQYYGLVISDSVNANLDDDLTLLADEINNFSYPGYAVTATLTDPTDDQLANVPPGGFNLFLTITESAPSATSYVGFDLSQYVANSDVLSASAFDVVPEPGSASLVAVTAIWVLNRRRRPETKPRGMD